MLNTAHRAIGPRFLVPRHTPCRDFPFVNFFRFAILISVQFKLRNAYPHKVMCKITSQRWPLNRRRDAMASICVDAVVVSNKEQGCRAPGRLSAGRWVSVVITALTLGNSSLANGESFDFFEEQVRPVLVKRCYECHSGRKTSGGLSLETAAGWQTGGESGPAIVPGNPDDSLLIDAINYRSLEMPPSDKGGKLSEDEIAVLTKWIAMGAPDPRTDRNTLGGMDREQADVVVGVSAVAAVEPELMPAHIDAFLQARLDEHSLMASRPGRQAYADSPRHVRPDWTAAVAGGSGRVSGG